jgi:glycerophosphoryl diester phosphodiesterase
MDEPPVAPRAMTRRTALRLGVGVLGIGGVSVLAGCTTTSSGRPTGASATTGPGSTTTAAPTGAPSSTAVRPSPSVLVSSDVGSAPLVVHRGSGDVFPENSLEGYRWSLDRGARIAEISVRATSDGTMIAMHDATYDRTTTGTGAVAEQPYSYTETLTLKAPQLGPGWKTAGLAVPTLDSLLDAVGGRMLLALEAKDDSLAPRILAEMDRRGLRDTMILKTFHTSTKRIAAAQQEKLPVFAYYGSTTDLTEQSLTELAGQLHKGRDFLVLWGYQPDGSLLDPSLVRFAVDTGHLVWVASLHRRSDAATFRELGVTGVVTADYGYLAGTVPVVTADNWASRELAPGELMKVPDSAATPLYWDGDGGLQFRSAAGDQQFIALGNFSPVAAADATYTVDLDVQWTRLPAERSGAVELAIGHADDRYYQSGAGTANGYGIRFGADGTLALTAHTDTGPAVAVLGAAGSTAPEQGAWAHLRVTVSPTGIDCSRTDLATPLTVGSTDTRFRGGYLHLGRIAPDAAVTFRRLTVTPG